VHFIEAQMNFEKLNLNWNADPNAPHPEILDRGRDIILVFRLNSYVHKEFKENECGGLKFIDVARYRMGSINDHGWYLGQCRFSKLAPAWGQFYSVSGDGILLEAPTDWITKENSSNELSHFLFYFRDEEFECLPSMGICPISRKRTVAVRQNEVVVNFG
jgi:hypothetical protein